MPTCILCSSENVRTIDNVSVEDLNRVYLKEYGIDIREDVKSDMTLEHCQICNLKWFNPLYPAQAKFYSELQKFEWYYKAEKFEYKFVGDFIKRTPNLRDASRILEVGCGVGSFSTYVDAEFTGLEFNPTACEEAQKLGRDVQCKSIEEASKDNSLSYDIVCSFQVLEHVVNPKQFIESCVSVLKPGGALILTTPSEDAWLQYKQDFALNLPPHHVTRWGEKTFRLLNKIIPEINLVYALDEPLDDFHIPWYLNAMITHQINKRLGVKYSVIKQNQHRISHLVADVLTKIIGKDLPSAFHGPGHTKIAVFSKH